jgi:hypothetical protein
MDTIPGADTLGFGFNINKSYDEKSTTQRIFNEGKRDASTITIGKTVYGVPENVAVAIRSETDGISSAFSTREEVQNYFAGKAGVSVSSFGFEGQFESAYKFVSTSEKSYTYGLFDAWNHAFTVKLKEQGSSMFTQAFRDDLGSLPTKFSKSDEDIFFAFFDTYGTHYVHQVQLGGSLYYYVAIEKSNASSEKEIRGKINAEYKAVFAKTKVEAEAEWKAIGKQWAESRSVRLHTVGGDSAMDGLVPAYGDWKGEFFQKWADSLANKPGQTDFNLLPISKLAPLAKRRGMEEALREYLRGGLIVKADRDSTPHNVHYKYHAYPTIIGPEGTVAPQPPIPHPPRREDDVDGIQVVLLEPETLKAFFNRAYYLNPDTVHNVEKMWADLYADIKAVTVKDYYCAVSVFGLRPLYFPSPEVAAWLSECGAKLSKWKEYIGVTSAASGAISYTFAGRNTVRRGQEDFRLDLTRRLNKLDSTTMHFLRGGGLAKRSELTSAS